MEGIRSVSETGNDVLGEQGSVAMIQSLFDGCTSPPPSVEALLSQPELMGAADADGTNLRDHIQVLDTIRHMKKGWEESLALCSNLVRVILQSVDTYTNETHDVLGQEVLQCCRPSQWDEQPLACRVAIEPVKDSPCTWRGDQEDG